MFVCVFVFFSTSYRPSLATPSVLGLFVYVGGGERRGRAAGEHPERRADGLDVACGRGHREDGEEQIASDGCVVQCVDRVLKVLLALVLSFFFENENRTSCFVVFGDFGFRVIFVRCFFVRSFVWLFYALLLEMGIKQVFFLVFLILFDFCPCFLA